MLKDSPTNANPMEGKNKNNSVIKISQYYKMIFFHWLKTHVSKTLNTLDMYSTICMPFYTHIEIMFIPPVYVFYFL